MRAFDGGEKAPQVSLGPARADQYHDPLSQRKELIAMADYHVTRKTSATEEPAITNVERKKHHKPSAKHKPSGKKRADKRAPRGGQERNVRFRSAHGSSPTSPTGSTRPMPWLSPKSLDESVETTVKTLYQLGEDPDAEADFLEPSGKQRKHKAERKAIKREVEREVIDHLDASNLKRLLDIKKGLQVALEGHKALLKQCRVCRATVEAVGRSIDTFLEQRFNEVKREVETRVRPYFDGWRESLPATKDECETGFRGALEASGDLLEESGWGFDATDEAKHAMVKVALAALMADMAIVPPDKRETQGEKYLGEQVTWAESVLENVPDSILQKLSDLETPFIPELHESKEYLETQRDFEDRQKAILLRGKHTRLGQLIDQELKQRSQPSGEKIEEKDKHMEH